MINGTNCVTYRIYHKILDQDWFSTRSSVTSSMSITWVSDCLNLCNWIPLIGYPCDLHVNYACVSGFFRIVSDSFQHDFMKSATNVFTQQNFPKDIFNSKICYRYD